MQNFLGNNEYAIYSNGNLNNNLVDFTVGSMPANYGYDENFTKEEDIYESKFKSRILIMGLRK